MLTSSDDEWARLLQLVDLHAFATICNQPGIVSDIQSQYTVGLCRQGLPEIIFFDDRSGCDPREEFRSASGSLKQYRAHTAIPICCEVLGQFGRKLAAMVPCTEYNMRTYLPSAYRYALDFDYEPRAVQLIVSDNGYFPWSPFKAGTCGAVPELFDSALLRLNTN